jgi:hypothetical protein
MIPNPHCALWEKSWSFGWLDSLETVQQILVQISGGLGNQMFQYAAGRALALRLNAELKLDLSWFADMQGCTQRRYMLDAFKLPAAIADREECLRLIWAEESYWSRLKRFCLRRPRVHADSFVAEPHFAYWPGFESIASDACLAGYWQNEQYFKAVEERIRQDFTFPPLPAHCEEIAERLRQDPASVAVHVRRGDYCRDPHTNTVHGLCDQEYYRAALALLADHAGAQLSLFLFSDEPDWLRDNFDTQGIPATIADFPEHVDAPWHDMHLMTLCRYHIIANSSFSWWGAWLARRDSVFAPRRWFADPVKMADNPAPDRWMLL